MAINYKSCKYTIYISDEALNKKIHKFKAVEQKSFNLIFYSAAKHFFGEDTKFDIILRHEKRTTNHLSNLSANIEILAETITFLIRQNFILYPELSPKDKDELNILSSANTEKFINYMKANLSDGGLLLRSLGLDNSSISLNEYINDLIDKQKNGVDQISINDVISKLKNI